MSTNILKLNDLCKQRFFIKKMMGGSETTCEEIIISAANIDDIFIVLRELDIMEIKIDFDTMFLIYRFVLANYQGIMITELNGVLSHDYDTNLLKMIQASTIEKYYGVQLILEK